MATHTNYHSWGRTRGIRNLAGAHGTESVTSTSLPTVTDATAGYATQNQRFLHLQLDTSAAGETKTVTVVGFSHAFGRWAPLTDVRGNAVTTGAVASTAAYKIFEIDGIDRVAFVVSSGALNASNFFFAGCSTF